MSKNKVIIIGAGLGGLLTGAILAKEGLQVTLVEKNVNVGGGLQSYKRFGTTFDTGMHIFGGMNPGGNIRRICDYLCITEDFHVKNLDNSDCVSIYVKEENRTYVVDFGKDSFVESFAKYFPNQRTNLKLYLDAIYGIMDNFDLFHLRPNRKTIFKTSEDFVVPVNDFIAKYVSNQKLQSLLAIVNHLYAGEKDITPAFLHSAISMIFLNGACRVVGGYSNFAQALVKCIASNGGKVIVGAPISKIITADKRIKAVSINQEQIDTDMVVSAIPIQSMINVLDNKKALSNAYQELVFSKKDSLSAFIINIKLKENTLKYSDKIGFYLKSYDSVWKSYTGTDIEKFMYMTPPSLNQGEYAETLNIILPMNWDVVEKWENSTVGHRSSDYYSFKVELYELVLDELATIIHEIKDMVADVDTATPLTIRDYTGVGHGAMCGERKDCNSILHFMPVVTRIPNLYITGQSVLMHGFCGVSLTAIQTCEAILGEDYLINKLNRQK